jgi:hypothetical protein
MTSAPRFRTDYPVILETRQGRVSGVTFNMSQSGVGLRIPDSCEIHVGTDVKLRLHFMRPGFGDDPPTISTCDLQARIIWRRKARCGLKITSSAEEARVFYESLLDGFRVLDEFKVAA